jgi:hypothetical protein
VPEPVWASAWPERARRDLAESFAARTAVGHKLQLAAAERNNLAVVGRENQAEERACRKADHNPAAARGEMPADRKQVVRRQRSDIQARAFGREPEIVLAAYPLQKAVEDIHRASGCRAWDRAGRAADLAETDQIWPYHASLKVTKQNIIPRSYWRGLIIPSRSTGAANVVPGDVWVYDTHTGLAIWQRHTVGVLGRNPTSSLSVRRSSAKQEAGTRPANRTNPYWFVTFVQVAPP